jgi:hypothetical protein
MSTNQSSWQVAPLEHMVHPEGHVEQKKPSWRVAPLEHVVHPEGHVTQKKPSWKVAPLEHMVHPEGHIAIMFDEGVSLNIPKTSTPE